ncbi:MAG TPA: aldehyde dehydrogenase family protein [Dehalococcoidia bacterium]|nr:aldehyde dehydrogenase family protein [Dehalococcoidia bacterium]
MPETAALSALQPGMPIPFGGDRVSCVTPELAARFRPGDRLVVVQETGELLLIPAEQQAIAAGAVGRAAAAFAAMGTVADAQITRFYEAFANRLEDGAVWREIAAANARDVESARARGRSTTRLEATEKMRRDMIAGLHEWRDAPPQRDRVVETVEQPGLRVDLLVAGLGVVGFVFEGRPNVFADATGVLRGGNTVVFRIGSDALGTARAIVRCALDPALAEAGLPPGAASLVESAEHAAGWAMFTDRRLALAVARGSGPAVAQLGAVARQSGIPVSLHGAGGAWLIAGESAPATAFAAAVYHSLDRKVCNTLNVCCIVRERAAELVPLFLDALCRAGERRGHGSRLHVARGSEACVPAAWFETRTLVRRAEGDVEEPLAELLDAAELGREWEWEETPEVTLIVVENVAEAVALFNRHSPRLVASLIAADAVQQAWFYQAVDAPFVSDGFTRWVDGQYALRRPELGLSNWQHGRLFARGGVLSGDGVFTVRTRATQSEPDLHR